MTGLPPETGPDETEITSDQYRLQKLLAANRSIVSELSLVAVLRRIVDTARDIAQAQYAALGVIGMDGRLEQFVHAGMDPTTVEAIGDLPRGRGVLGALIADPRSIRLHRIAEDPRSSGFPPRHPAMGSFLGVPIQGRGEAFGNLYLTNRRDGEDFTAEDEDLISVLAATASVAIENARLYEESRRRQEWLRASAEISRHLLLPDAPATDTLTRVADTVRRLTAADIVTVVFPDESGSRLRVQIARGRQADELVGYTYPRAGSLAGQAIDEGRALRLEADHGQYFVHLQTAFDVGPVMACPLLAGDSIRAAVIVGRRVGSTSFATQDLDMAEAFASYAAVAFELADRREDQRRLEVLEDRHRIARDLHDHVIQRLFAAGLKIQAAASGSVDPQLQQRLGETVDDIDETIRQIRSAIFELQDRRGTASTARAVLLRVATEVEPALGFVPDLSFAGPVDTVLDPELLQDVEAVLREGLTNSAKHSDATRVSASVQSVGQQIIVEISDNGSAGPAVWTRRSGLANLQARAARRHGKLEFVHTGAGTTLQWTVCLTP